MNAPREPCGLLVVDKPRGPTSHDVVAKVKRALATRRVGHAGTLDPMATGVLLVLVGEATKLAPYLTSDKKVYLATVALGTSTDTWDAEGMVVEERALDAELRGELARGGGARIAEALKIERERTQQVPPAFSAVHIDGRRSYELARRGQQVDLAPRDVIVHSLRLLSTTADPPSLEVELDVSKGYYVRAFAHALAGSLSIPAHLAALRRVKSGAFSIDQAASLDRDPRGALLPLEDAARMCLPVATLTEEGATRARQGKVLGADDFEETPRVDGACAWMVRRAGLVAVGERSDDGYVVRRGFHGA